MKLDALWVGGWPYGVSILNNRWPQIRFIVRRRRVEKGEMGGGGGGFGSSAAHPTLVPTKQSQLAWAETKAEKEGGREGGID